MIKELIFGIWNPNNARDKTGKIIDDTARKRHIKETVAKIESGSVTLNPKKPGETRLHKIISNGSASVCKQK